MSRTKKDGLSLFGVAAAGCVACCAGPILALLGGLSAVGMASTVVIGGTGIVVAVVAATAFFVRRANNACAGGRTRTHARRRAATQGSDIVTIAIRSSARWPWSTKSRRPSRASA